MKTEAEKKFGKLTVQQYQLRQLADSLGLHDARDWLDEDLTKTAAEHDLSKQVMFDLIAPGARV